MKYIILLITLLTAMVVNAVVHDGPVDMDDNTGSGFYFLEPIADHSDPPAYFMRINNDPCKVAISANHKILMWSPFLLERNYVKDDVVNDTSYVKIEGGLYSGSFRIPDVAQINDMKNNVLYGRVTSISMGTFAKCHELTSVSLPAGLEEIRRGAFYDCTALTEVKFPISTPHDYLTGVMLFPHAFRGCTSLRKIDLRFAGQPRSSNGDVFVDCPNLEEVILRADIEDVHMNLGGRTFPSIRRITLENNTSVYSQRVCYSGRMVFFPEEYKTAVVIVPDGWKYKYSLTFPWSEFTNIITESEAAGLDDITLRIELVRVENGIVTLVNHDLNVSVYDTTGRKVCDLSAANPSFRPDSPGLYMLYSSAGSQKVLIH